MDALAVRALCMELQDQLTAGKVDKIHQPTDRDIVITVRTRSETHRLLLSAHKSFARAHLLTRERPRNPEEPPMFCMLLRKRLESGRIVEVRQQGWDRVVELIVESMNEIGDIVHYALILEIMGKHSNLILTTTDEHRQPLKIVDSLVHVTHGMSRARQVLPGLPYQPAPPQSKLLYSDVRPDHVAALHLDGKGPKAQHLALCGLVAGIGPATAKEVLFRANASGNPDAAGIVVALKEVMSHVLHREESASVSLDEVGVANLAAPFELRSAAVFRHVPSLSEGLEQVYVETASRMASSALAKDLATAVLAHLDRLRGKQQKLLKEQVDSTDYESFRIKGELLTAYPHMVEKGLETVALPNFYDEERPLEIALDPAQSAIENAQRYFKMASKKKRALPLLAAELEQTAADTRYLEEVLTHLQDARTEHLAALRQELEKEGFLKTKQSKQAKQGKQAKNSKRNVNAGKSTTPASAPDSYVSGDGFTMFVGRNNQQNDRLTLKSSQPNDVWLHVKDIPGSHVVIRTDKSADVPDATLSEASLLAAYFSKGKNSANVPVDYTLIKHVWKPNGARPGHVLYDHQKTLYVTPNREAIDEIFRRKRP